MKPFPQQRRTFWLTAVALSVASAEVFADPAEIANLLPPLTVIADKQQQSIDDVSAYVTAYQAEALQQEGVDSLSKLESKMPGLSFQPFGQSGVNSPVMRGLTANFNALSTSTLLLVDGVPTLTAQGFENSLLGVDRVELLRGPQSTVYGRNAQAGVLSIYSNDLNGKELTRVGVEVGSRSKQGLQFATSQSLQEGRLRVSLAGELLKQDGFIDHANQAGKVDDRERQTINAGLRWLASDNTDLTLRYRQQEYDDGAMLWGPVGGERVLVASGTDSWNRSHSQTFSANLVHDMNADTRLHSITAYNQYQDRVQQDTDFQPIELAHIGRDHTLRTLSQEFRLEGSLGKSEWLLGAYLEQQDHDLRTYSKTPFGALDLRAQQEGEAYALFSNWTTPLTEDTRLVYGVRLAQEEVQLLPEGAEQQTQRWYSTSPQVALQYDLTPQHMLYVSYAEGIRAGGFNTLSPAVNFSVFDPEESQSIELGIKGQLNVSALRYSLATYHMNIDNMQVMQMPAMGVIYLTNAAQGTSQGVEASLDYYFAERWSTELGLAWNKTRFDEFVDGSNNYADKRNPFAPELNGHLTLRYEGFDGWSASASVVANSSVYLDAANTYKQEGYTTLNIAGQYPLNERATLSAYANNVSNQEYDAVGYQNGNVTVYSPPRELGLKLTWEL
ncbi:Pesticin receptor precursor [Marinomonas gallaica]|uniref:Pesticin receptor n=1 Tax=Marinomonas gallaica TaxID=1806667 RepID=A0A1C3JNZ5_9GAMM|nr:TonB-dependent receptor [Marinomonas gallaica]SBT16896.1 Pesticin receptor precursor [Marinomonas gallaica]SBT22153.1 Pesticin receptor precursor [Marinomonas gallaica]